MTDTEWRKLDWLPSYYSLGSDGRIKSEYGGKIRFLSGVRSPTGYQRVCIKLPDGSHVSKFGHRLIAEAFFGKSALCVNHKNGNKTDNRIENLEYVTPAENSAHANIVLDAFLRGENNPYAKLNGPEVEIILALHANGVSQTELSKQFNCSKGNIGFIVRRVTWRHIQPATASNALPPLT